jgi:hypothetical protein
VRACDVRGHTPCSADISIASGSPCSAPTPRRKCSRNAPTTCGMAASIGWMSVGVLARVTTEVLRRAGADRLFAQHGGERLRARSEGFRPSLVAGELAKWLIRIVILVAAANVLGMTQVSELLSQIVLWIPNPIVAVVTLLVAPLLARFVRGAIEVGAGEMGFTKPRSWVGLPRLRLSRLPWSSPSTRSASPPT